MKRFLAAALVTGFVLSQGTLTRADEKEAKVVIDKAIKAAGGEEKLTKARVLTWTVKGTVTVNGNDGALTGKTTVEGLEHYRAGVRGRSQRQSDQGCGRAERRQGLA